LFVLCYNKDTPREKKGSSIMKNISEMTVSEQLGTILAWGLKFFLNPALVMWGWEALAPHLNAPLFAYWEVLCICHGANWILSFVFRPRK